MRRILVTSALPYANGPIHIGHLVEYLQTDIWVRFQKLMGNECRYFCADDTHGTAIMISAKRAGVTEEQFIERVSAEHQQDFAGFDIQFDNYGSTHSDENRALCEEIWAAIAREDLLVEQEVEQPYDSVEETFLADRLIIGTCPNCGAPQQYGDHCEKCLSNYQPTELIDGRSSLSGTTPELRAAPHKFVQLEKLRPFLEEWVDNGQALQEEIANYLKGHFLYAKDKEGNIKPLRDWDVTRPHKYFGFEIPGFEKNYWYVWFDAPIGYMASTKQWCDKHGEDFDRWWRSDQCEVHHFIGKDITYFHTLFWPGMLKTAGFSLPTKVHIHGFLTVNGEKMSKSRGTFVAASTYLKHLDPAYLRYFYASKLSSKVDDIDLSIEEFIAKVNTDLVGKVVNLASRSAKFVASTGLSSKYPDDGGLLAAGAAAGKEIAEAYEACDYSKAMRLIMALADRANPFVEENKPWELRKDESQAERLQDVCTVALNLFRQLAIYLAPVLPKLAEQAGELLNDPIVSWDQAQEPLVGTAVNKFKHMLQRVEEAKVNAMIEESKPEETTDETAEGTFVDKWNDPGDSLEAEPLAEECTFDEFLKVDLRVARVVSAEQVPEARKLLKLKLSLGGGTYKQVFAGIKAAYDPEKLVGRLVVCVANLAPRTMKFGVSEGMVVASGPGGEEVFVLSPDEGAKVGQRVH
ncbi:Methionine--tRNA ligase [Aeoliella mucimassa]|uniref:Methionine--tRNA ligase n=1 Tax=Aeoliella mucimassa TaxID=2527972 RepID=A0A518AVF7_9BACT|nr:Methionine--tRNA ligase [Aeoliella mucimassa]